MAEWVSVHTCVSEWCVPNSQAWCFHYAGDVLCPIQTDLRSLAPSFSLDGELEECGTPLYLQNLVLEKDFLQQKPQVDSVTVESMTRLTVLSLWLPLYGCVTGKRHWSLWASVSCSEKVTIIYGENSKVLSTEHGPKCLLWPPPSFPGLVVSFECSQ